MSQSMFYGGVKITASRDGGGLVGLIVLAVVVLGLVALVRAIAPTVVAVTETAVIVLGALAGVFVAAVLAYITWLIVAGCRADAVERRWRAGHAAMVTRPAAPVRVSCQRLDALSEPIAMPAWPARRMAGAER